MEVIEKMPPSVSVKEVRSFLRHVGFYRRFIKVFSKTKSPFCKLVEQKVKFEFGVDNQKLFEDLKKRLTEAPTLIIPD